MSIDSPPQPQDLPYLTADIPGLGGRIKSTPDDFRVDELPLYQPCGLGTHAYALIEKRGLTTPEAAHRIARALGKQPRDIGFAGLKDAHAVTRQTLLRVGELLRLRMPHIDSLTEPVVIMMQPLSC